MEQAESSCKRTKFLSDCSSAEPSDDEGITRIKKVLEEKRKWRLTDLGLKHVKSPLKGLDFTVMTYNVLSQKNLENSLYLYSHCDDKVLEWQFRESNLLSELQQHNCDIICLQELEDNAFLQSFKPQLESSGYSAIYKKKTGDQCDGCAIFFKQNIFDLIKHVAVEFKQPHIPVLDRHNVGLIALLETKHGDKLVISTTHLLYNPRRGDVKLSQLRLFLAEIDKLAFVEYSDVCRPRYHPVILCGDFNAEPFSPLYNFITCGSIFFKDMKAGVVSGQAQGMNKGRMLNRNDLSLLALGINYESKYDATDLLRQKKFIWKDDVQNSASADSHEEHSIEKETVSTEDRGPSKLSVESTSVTKTEPEYFSHKLNLLSAYTHFNLDETSEATIYNNDSCGTVDYIFHNVNKKFSFVMKEKPIHKCVEEGPLQLLGNYGLLGTKDLHNIGGLPNALLSSDHVCLISRFLLTSK